MLDGDAYSGSAHFRVREVARRGPTESWCRIPDRKVPSLLQHRDTSAVGKLFRMRKRYRFQEWLALCDGPGHCEMWMGSTTRSRTHARAGAVSLLETAPADGPQRSGHRLLEHLPLTYQHGQLVPLSRLPGPLHVHRDAGSGDVWGGGPGQQVTPRGLLAAFVRDQVGAHRASTGLVLTPACLRQPLHRGYGRAFGVGLPGPASVLPSRLVIASHPGRFPILGCRN